MNATYTSMKFRRCKRVAMDFTILLCIRKSFRTPLKPGKMQLFSLPFLLSNNSKDLMLVFENNFIV